MYLAGVFIYTCVSFWYRRSGFQCVGSSINGQKSFSTQWNAHNKIQRRNVHTTAVLPSVAPSIRDAIAVLFGEGGQIRKWGGV